jgi:tetratricopeptide (TPR) repeat protein
MPKIERNAPCPCGSGKKYKRCCLEKDQAAESAVFATRVAAAAEKEAQVAAATAAKIAASKAQLQQQWIDLEQQWIDSDIDLANSSNAVRKLIDAGRIDEAETAARDLLVRFPEVHDGYDRLGMVYEARGQNKLAADCYRQVIDFVRAHPDQYAPEFETTFHRLIAKLDPPATDADRELPTQ